MGPSSSALHFWESNLRAHSGITCSLAAPGREASLYQPCSARPCARPARVRRREPSQPLCTLFPSPSPTPTSPGLPPLVFPLLLIGQFGELICARVGRWGWRKGLPPGACTYGKTGKQWTFYDVINVLVPTSRPFLLVSFLSLWVPYFGICRPSREQRPSLPTMVRIPSPLLLPTSAPPPPPPPPSEQCSLVTKDVPGVDSSLP